VTIKPLDPRSQKALDYAQEAVKQLLTLATGIILLTLTFFKNFAASDSAAARDVIESAWIVLALSIVCGLIGLLSMTSHLWPRKEADRTNNPPDIWKGELRWMGVAQVVLFGVGLVLTLIAGGLAL
jgi:hypothetical protein